MTSTSKPSRLPWIVAGVLGCLVVCLLLVVVGSVAFVILGPTMGSIANVPVTSITRAPFGLNPTSPAAPVGNQTQAAVTVVLGPPPTAMPTAATSAATPTLPAAPTVVAKAAATATAAPKGKIAFSMCAANCDQDDGKTVWIMNADGSGLKKIADRASEPTFSPDGSQIAYYHWTDGIYVMSADGSGAPGKKIVGDTMVGFIEWSHDGRLIAFSAQPGGKGNIVVDVVSLPDGKDRHNIAVGQSPSWSPDDTELVFDTCRGNNCGIYKGNSGGGEAIPVIADGGGLPAWSPDGKKIAYQAEIDGQKQIYVINPDGSGKKQLTSGAAMHVGPTWSADGQYIYYRSPEGGSWGIWRMNADGSGPVKLIGDVPPVNAGQERIAVTR
jgi:hypothetical protein